MEHFSSAGTQKCFMKEKAAKSDKIQKNNMQTDTDGTEKTADIACIICENGIM